MEINNATYARDNNAILDLSRQIASEIGKIQEALTPLSTDAKDYRDFITVLNKNWFGPSKDRFVEDLERRMKETKDKLETIKSNIGNSLLEEKDRFVSMDQNAYQTYK